MADTRRQILLTIKEQAQLLLREPAAADLPGCTPAAPAVHRWSPQQWWEGFTFLFVNPQSSSSGAQQHQHQDDLLFFVSQQQQQQRGGGTAAAAAGSSSPPHVFVRRKGKQLPADLQLTGKDFANVDWAQTLLLNLVLHSQYQLTVVACGPEALPFVAEGRTWSPGTISVSRPVYACTTVTVVNLDSSRAKAANPQPCFPDICFTVDNFDNAFEDLVLEEESRCFCVVLHAMLDMHDTTAGTSAELSDVAARLNSSSLAQPQQPPGNQQQQQQQPQQQEQHAGPQHAPSNGNHSNNSSAEAAAAAAAAPPDTDAPVSLPARHHSSTDESGSGAWQIGTHKRTLFAGYVSFQQIADFMQGSSSSRSSSRPLLAGLFGGNRGAGGGAGGGVGPRAPQKDKVVMTGPGGMGRCEVAVTKTEAAAGPADNSSSHSVQPGQQQPGVAAATAGEQQQQQQWGQGLLQRGLQRARHVATGVQQALDVVLSEPQPGSSPAGSCHMLCALMTLRLPVQHLAQELLAAV